MDILRIERLNKSFGKNRVIDDLSLTVPEGAIFGFIGQNGAGKTTTMKMVLGLLPVDGGEIYVCGEKVRFGQTKTNEAVGYLPDVPEFYPYMKPMEYLALCGKVTGMDDSRIKSRSLELLELVGLENHKKRIGSYSRGMKQRLGIAQALLNEPKLLICDEPTSALDPVGRKEILDILETVKGKTTVLFSTHILSDVERICDRVAVLHQGKIQLCGTLQELKTQHKAEIIIVEFKTAEENIRFQGNNPQFAMEGKERTLTIRTGDLAQTQRMLMKSLLDGELYPEKIEVAEPTIESLFLGVVS